MTRRFNTDTIIKFNKFVQNNNTDVFFTLNNNNTDKNRKRIIGYYDKNNNYYVLCEYGWDVDNKRWLNVNEGTLIRFYFADINEYYNKIKTYLI